MARFIISYDLLGDNPKYAALHEALSKVGAKRVTESTWILKHSTYDTVKLREDIKGIVGSEMRCFIAEFGSSSSWNAMNKIGTYLDE